ncbi:hypothetical protein JCM8547_007523 [Rhodosporidiobolus lusitaniae]
MQALLLSPATQFEGDSSNFSNSSSPSTPPAPSLDFLEPSNYDSPSLRKTPLTPSAAPMSQNEATNDDFPTPQTPAWLTDQLDEEWIPQPSTSPTSPDSPTLRRNVASGGDDTQSTVVPSFPSFPSPSNTTATATPRPFNSLQRHNTAPRIPSSLRHAFTASVASSTMDLTGRSDERSFASSTGQGEGDGETSVLDFASIGRRTPGQPGEGAGETSVFLLGSSLPPSSGLAGGGDFTFVGDEEQYAEQEEEEEEEEEGASSGSCVVNSVVERSGSGVGNTQLRAAVRALRGPGAGILAEADEADEVEQEEELGKTPVAVAKGKKEGLLSLFEPPSPETANASPFPKSALPSGPSITSFTFSPPSPHSRSPESPESAHSSPASPAMNQRGNTSRWKDLMHFSPSPPPPSASKTRPGSSTPPPSKPTPATFALHASKTASAEATPVPQQRKEKRLAALSAAPRTPSVAPAATAPDETPVAGLELKKSQQPTVPTGVGRRERFLHRSTASQKPPTAVVEEVEAQEEQRGHEEDDEEGLSSEDVPFVPPPPPLEGLGSEEMSTTSGSDSEGFSDEEGEEERVNERYEQPSMVQHGGGGEEEDGFTSESEHEREEEEEREQTRRSWQEEEDEQVDEEEGSGMGIDLASRSMSALPSPSPSPAGLSLPIGLPFQHDLDHHSPHSLSLIPEEEHSSRSTLAPPLPSPSQSGLRSPLLLSLPPLPQSPARIPIPSPVLRGSSSTSAPRSPNPSCAPAPPASPYKLFQPAYDTLTRSHLLSLVDEIDSLSSSPEALRKSLLEGAPPPVRLPRLEEAEEEHEELEQEKSEEGFLGEEGERRSSKRIKLSPKSEFKDEQEQEEQENTPLRSSTSAPPATRPCSSHPRSHRTPGSTPSSSRPTRPRLSRGTTPFSPSPSISRRRATPHTSSAWRNNANNVNVDSSSFLPPLPSPFSAADGSVLSTPASAVSSSGFTSQNVSATIVPTAAALAETEKAEEEEQQPEEDEKARRRRERLEEAERVMERVVKRAEERRRERKRGEATPAPAPPIRTLARSPLKRASPGSSPSSAPPSPVGFSPPASQQQQPQHEESPPPLPHFVAAASASLRATLSLAGSPAPSPSLGASRTQTFGSTSSSVSSGPTSPALGSGRLRMPSGLMEGERKESIGRRHFARTPVGVKKEKGREEKSAKKGGGLLAQTKGVRGLFGTEEEDHAAEAVGEEQQEEEKDDFPTASTSSAAPPPASSRRTRGHSRHPSLTTLNPTSAQTQQLLATSAASARERGLVFDATTQRWIRTPRRRLSSPLIEQREEEDEEEDPFRDFSELRSNHSIRVPPPPPSAGGQQQEQRSSLDLDALPRAGDGSNRILPSSTTVDLSGLGITKGTPPSLVPSAPPPPAQVDSPASACYFSPPPAETRPAGEGAEGPVLELVVESEDSATWGRGESGKRAEEVRQQEEREEASALDLYRAAHADEADGEQSSFDAGTLDSRRDGGRQQAKQQQQHRHRPTSSTPAAALRSPLPPTPSAAADGASQATASRQTAPSQPTFTPSRPTAAVQPPRSALKQPLRSQSDPAPSTATPLGSSTPVRVGSDTKQPPRSVSFSDGKTSGKIANVSYRPSPLAALKPHVTGMNETETEDETGGEDDTGTASTFEGGPGELEFDERFGREEDGENGDAESTTTEEMGSARARRIGSALEELARGPDTSLSPVNASEFSAGLASRRRSFSRTTSQNGNATFLTECSFGVSRDRLLQFITDVEPFEPDWENLSSIDLSGKKAESVVRMKEFLPSLDEVNLNNNELTYLTGIPSTLRTLLISSNRLTSITSFQHLLRLERLDLSYNQLESVQQLACLRHLRELKADGNKIRTLEGLEGLDALVKVSLKGNEIEEVDFGGMKWARLETLHLARNKISSVGNLDKLASLSSLNLDHNLLTSLNSPAAMPRLRILRLCNNPLPTFDVSFAPKLRTLYIDSAKLGLVQGTEQLRKLENLSVRDQSGGALTLSMPHIRDVKRLYLSGNPLPSSFPSEKFFNLVYLELAMCQLTSLPANLASVVPNVRVLNLDYDFIDDLAPLAGLTRLAKLSVVGARLAKARPVAVVLSSLVELETVDFRMNPFTLAFYPPMVPSSESLLPSHAEHRILHPDSLPSSTPASSIADPATSSKAWQTLDTKFRRALPDEWYHKRVAYRSVVMQSVPTLLRLDGVDCAKERPKLVKRVEKLAAKRRTAGA